MLDSAEESKLCLSCDKEFYRGDIKPSPWNAKKYCSQKCRDRYRYLGRVEDPRKVDHQARDKNNAEGLKNYLSLVRVSAERTRRKAAVRKALRGA